MLLVEVAALTIILLLVEEALARPGDFARFRQTARQDIVAGYDIEDGVARYMALLQGS